MGIRESLLNTISSVSGSDFVRIVTAAGASSKATVANLFKSFESGLGAKSTLTTSDYVRVVGSDNASYKQSVGDVAKKIIENYTGSSLAGTSQSVKAALDSLNSKLVVKTITASSPATFSLGNGTRAIAFASSAYSENAGVANVSVANSGSVSAIKIAGMTSITFNTTTNNALTVSGTQYSVVGILVLTGSAN